jgi:cell division protein YceG involved in septum cleavage
MDNNIEKTGLVETVIGIIMDVAPIICVFIIIAWAGRAYTEGYGLFVQKSLDSPGDVQAHSEMVTISEEDAASALKVGRILENMDLISSRYSFALKARLTGYSHSILPGDYILSSDMTMEEILEKLSVDPATVPEDQADGETPADSGQSDSQEENKDVWGQ